MTKTLSFIRIVLLFLFLYCSQAGLTFAQASKSFELSGTVYEHNGSGAKKTIPNAIITISAYGIKSVTGNSGKFILSGVPRGQATLKVKLLGKITLDTSITVTENLNLKLYLDDETFRLNDVAVTAKNIADDKGISSRISRSAIDHLQANSLSDVMSLLPGGTTVNPDLSGSKQINIRSTVNNGSTSAASNAFGTSIVINGAPVSNNANLQAVSPSISGSTAAIAGADPGGGFDVRSISMDNVESVEVIRGVPGVEYGDVTSGVVIVNTKAGRQPLLVNAKTNPNVYQISATTGMNLGRKNGDLNLGFDFARNVEDPVQSYLTYKRITGNVLYSITFFDRLKSTSSLDLIYGNDLRKLNPDDEVTKTRSAGKDLGFIFNTRGELSFNKSWLRNLKYTARVGYTSKNSFLETQHTAATSPYSMTFTDGAILSNKPNAAIFDTDGRKLTNIGAEDREHYALMLPSTYLGHYDIDGKELNSYFKTVATFYNKLGNTNHRWLLGADFKSDVNNGSGKTFSNTMPPYRDLLATNSTNRPRAYKDIPALNQLGLFAEENFNVWLGERELQVSAGLRYDRFSGNKHSFSPRINASLAILPGLLSINGAYGKLAKAPALLHMSPENAYFEYININETAADYSDPVLMTTTRIFSTQNPDLKIVKNEKAELGFQLNIKQATLRVTAFKEQLNNGYALGSSVNSFRPVVYHEYFRPDIDVPAFELDQSNKVLASFMVPTNTRTANTRGLEFDLDLGKFDAISSAFSLNGAWIRTENYSNDYHYYDGQATTGGDGRTHIGLYQKGMIKRNDQSVVTALRSTHNIPKIGLVATLTTQVVLNESNWNVYTNQHMPVKYISKDDGLLYDFDPAKAGNPEFKTLIMPINERVYIRESFAPLLSFNFNLTKEIEDYMRVSFFANNMFRSYPLAPSKRSPGTYIQRNGQYFFGLQLSLTIK